MPGGVVRLSIEVVAKSARKKLPPLECKDDKLTDLDEETRMKIGRSPSRNRVDCYMLQTQQTWKTMQHFDAISVFAMFVGIFCVSFVFQTS